MSGDRSRLLRRIARGFAALGPGWSALELPAVAGCGLPSFLALGPGGIFAVTVKDHGRHRVSFYGESVRVAGRQYAYTQEARRNALFAARMLTRRVGVSVPVVPVLAFAGSGVISVHGMPSGIVLVPFGDLGYALNARGRRITPATVNKLFAVAREVATWVYVGQSTNRSREAVAGDAATKRHYDGGAARSAAELLHIVVRVLPAAHRARYSEEFAAELHDLALTGASRWQQLAYAGRLIDRAWVLRAELNLSARRDARP
jgi:hypothetical protein